MRLVVFAFVHLNIFPKNLKFCVLAACYIDNKGCVCVRFLEKEKYTLFVQHGTPYILFD